MADKRKDSDVAIANRERNLLKFREQPITYKNGDLDVIVDYYSIDDLPETLKQWTFDVIKSNMYDLYAKSNDGWDDEGKKAEMQAPEARYLIARSASDKNDLKGYIHFQMVFSETMSDEMAQVAYCMELQLVESARNFGLGEFLMNLLYDIGSYWKMEKVMLTVFKANKGAFKFYTKKLGFDLDEISPGACLSALRARKFDYEILSKPIK